MASLQELVSKSQFYHNEFCSGKEETDNVCVEMFMRTVSR
jgi:hypothetical protein